MFEIAVIGLCLCISTALLFGSTKTNQYCLSCQEKAIDPIESICGHIYCGNTYSDHCWQSEQCKCGYNVTMLFASKTNYTSASYNLNHSCRDLSNIIYDTRHLLRKILALTLQFNIASTIKPWSVFLGLSYILLDFKFIDLEWPYSILWFVFVNLFSALVAGISFFNAELDRSANYFIRNY